MNSKDTQPNIFRLDSESETASSTEVMEIEGERLVKALLKIVSIFF